MAGICKFINELLHEWPILFMDDYRAKEWLSEKKGIGNSVKMDAVLANSEGASNGFSKRLVSEPPLLEKSTAYIDGLFDNIWGFDDIKSLFRRAISSDKQIHILLVGPPASAKSMFMEHLMKLNNSLFAIGSQSTKAGLVDGLFERRPRFLIIDEIEKMSENDQTVLLSLMEGGTISETKYTRCRETILTTSVFATANSKDNLLAPLLTRFCVSHLKLYSFEEFQEITSTVLSKEGVDIDIANEIAHIVWTKMNSRNIRDCVRLSRMANNSSEDLHQIVNTLVKYESQI
jgi:replication-associated recombination protein RarA